MFEPKLINLNKFYCKIIIEETILYFNNEPTKYYVSDILKLFKWDIDDFINLLDFNTSGIPRPISFTLKSLTNFYEKHNSTNINIFFNEHAFNNQVKQNLDLLFIPNFKNYYPFLLSIFIIYF
jgi:hypothetical protein